MPLHPPPPVSARTLIAGLALAALVVVTYAPSARYGFVNFDDPLYVTAEPRMREGITAASLCWAATGPHAKLWHPLTTLSHLADVERCGFDAGCHHETSIALHAANAALAVVLLTQLTGRLEAGLVGATFFALHPLRVESVTWVSERKDVLSLFFGLLAILTHVGAARRPGGWGHVLVVVLGASAMLAKPMLVTLPALLLLLDVWPLDRPRTRALILEKVPLITCAAIVSILTYASQSTGGAVSPLDAIPMGTRIANAAVSVGRYLAMTVAPRNLAVFYPYTPLDPVRVAGAAMLIVAVTALAWRQRRRAPAVAVGWAWYLLALLPVIGLIQAGSQSHADRFTYLPSLGLALGFGWLVDHAARRSAHTTLVVAAVTALLAVGAIAGTRRQLPVWRNSETLFRGALAATSDNYVAHVNLGHALAEAGRADEAAMHYRDALRMNPHHVPALVNVGNMLARAGRLEEASAHYRRAIERDPSSPEAHNGLGLVLDRTTGPADALAEFDRALAAAPGHSDARLNRAHALRVLRRWEEAAADYDRVLRSTPEDPEAHYGLALVRIAGGDEAGAATALREALRIRPEWPEVLEVMAWLLASASSEDVRDAREAIRLGARARDAGGDSPRALIAMATAHLALGDVAAAREAAERARVSARARADRVAEAEAERLLLASGEPGVRPR